jgi:hypothetical protein
MANNKEARGGFTAICVGDLAVVTFETRADGKTASPFRAAFATYTGRRQGRDRRAGNNV